MDISRYANIEKKPGNIPMLEHGDLFASPQRGHIPSLQKYRRGANLHDGLIDTAQLS